MDQHNRSEPAEHQASRKSTLVIGLGNPLAADDRVGLLVAEALAQRLVDRPDVEVARCESGGWTLVERLGGFQRVILIDAVCSGGEPGTVHRATVGSIVTNRSLSTHDLDFSSGLALARLIGVELPPDDSIAIIGIEIADTTTLGGSCTPAIATTIPRAVECVLSLLDTWPVEKGLPQPNSA